jgi:hypothetical protein
LKLIRKGYSQKTLRCLEAFTCNESLLHVKSSYCRKKFSNDIEMIGAMLFRNDYNIA